MSPRRFLLWRQFFISVGHSAPPCPSNDHLAGPLSLLSPFVSRATEWSGPRYFSSTLNEEEAGVSETRWHELPPVPNQGLRRAVWEVNKAKGERSSKGSDLGDEENGTDYGAKQITALQWVMKCCPTLPSNLLHKLFRVRQVRQRILLPNTQHTEQPSDAPGSQELMSKLRRVSLKAALEEGSLLYLPRSVFQYEADMLPGPGHNVKKTQHQPSTSEVTLLQSLVLYKDAEILVINKPPGLPVQGGSQIKRSLDSLMGTALSFDRDEGPRLVHRLDKETSGLMILARTQECATFLHTLFREKTATASEAENDNTSIKRVYCALVIGTPKKPQGRISVPLMKVVLDEGRGDKIVIRHDFSSENAQVAITDYKVLGPSVYGCTWLELRPLTGRKHQLRVHCAEVLGTPVFGDMKYGWRTQKEWLTKISPEQHMKAVKGSILSSVPMLHLHCGEMVIPNVLQMLEKHRSRSSCVDVNSDCLQFFARLPSHMAASRNIWSRNSSAESHETVAQRSFAAGNVKLR